MEGLGRTPCTSWGVGRDGIGGRDFRKGASCGAGAGGKGKLGEEGRGRDAPVAIHRWIWSRKAV